MSWFKIKDDNQIKVKCPKCGRMDTVSKSISSFFCKNVKCGATIYPAKAKISETEVASTEVSNNQATHLKKSSTVDNVSALKHEEVQINSQTDKSTNTFSAQSAQKKIISNASAQMSSGMKKITCSSCHTVQEVPSIALASFCEKCGQRINLQDYKIKGPFHGELETRGKICIAEGAEVKAELNVGHAIIEGKIHGKIIAERRVELNDGCMVVGTITSPVLVVNDGAGFVGKAIINPSK